MITPRTDVEDGSRYYTVDDVMTLSVSEYTRWVYDVHTARVDEVRIYKTKRMNRLLNSWPVWLPHAVWLPVAIALLFPLDLTRVAMALAGFAAFFPLELCFHRFLFHMPIHSRAQQRMHLVMHGSHHLCPKNAGRLTSHPLLVLGYSSVIYGLLSLLSVPMPDAVLGGLLLSYLRTDSTHVAVHLVSARVLRSLPFIGHFLAECQRHHQLHHSREPHAKFAIGFYF